MRVSYVESCVNCILEMASRYLQKPYNLLELFGGRGRIYTQFLAQKCTSTIGWEINKDCENEFLKNVPNSKFINIDTVKTLSEADEIKLGCDVNIISIDNPLGIYNGKYCEHFELIDHIHKVIKHKSIVAFNIVKKPYGIETQQNWVVRRKQFYDTDLVELDMSLIPQFYQKILINQGLNVYEMKLICRELHEGQDYFYMLICALEPGNGGEESK
ncbi:hypothetical protein [Lutispora sp.]|uniref:hypothetical protein n=1 Tax=Lutispora sp. TaxID=2828727 RepID=UPI003566653D